MKIAYLINQYPRVSHSFVRREIRALEELGMTVDRFAMRGPPEEIVDQADLDELKRTRIIVDQGAAKLLLAMVLCALGSPLRFLAALRLTYETGKRSERGLLINLIYLAEACVLRRWLTDHEHVHAHFGTNSTAVAMLCNALGGPGYSFTCHGPEEFDKPLLLCLRQKIERARFVVAITSFCRSQLYRHCSFPHWKKVEVVHCALDDDYLQSEPPPLPDVPRMVTVGRLNEQKGQMLLVRAAAELAKEGVEFELNVVGDGEMRGELEAAIAEHGLDERVKILGWATSDGVREQLANSRVFVLPSFAEGLPVVIMEALAMGRPVLTTTIAGIPELVDEQCGWLVPPGSVERLVPAMRAALTASTEDLEKMGSVGRNRALQEHDVHREAAKLKALFEHHVAQVES